jgi:hypothetical protein
MTKWAVTAVVEAGAAGSAAERKKSNNTVASPTAGRLRDDGCQRPVRVRLEWIVGHSNGPHSAFRLTQTTFLCVAPGPHLMGGQRHAANRQRHVLGV